MAQLEARHEDSYGAWKLLWRHHLPVNRPISIGRRPLTDTEVPEWNRSDWVVEDPKVSGRHASLIWDGTNLQVQRRLEPENARAKNPVYLNGIPNDSFKIAMGGVFSIGNTVFEIVADTPGGGESIVGHSPTLVSRSNRDELRKTSFSVGNSPLTALAELPNLIRCACDETELEQELVKLILRGLPRVDVAAIVVCDSNHPEQRAAVKTYEQRGTRGDIDFRPSNTLVQAAIRDRLESILYIWQQDSTESPEINATYQSNSDWAICAPLFDSSARNLEHALYITGRLPRAMFSSDQLRNDPELREYQKFLDLAIEIVKSIRTTQEQERQNAQLKRYIPKAMEHIMSSEDLESLLEPKSTDVTVLFCDIRGSCKHAEENEDNPMEAWEEIRESLTIMTAAITDKDGVVGDLQGDAAMGFWGWPEKRDDQLERAVTAAFRIRKDFARRNIALACGIGISNGKAIVGRLGTYDHAKLDAYGVVLNRGARLQSMTKYFGVQILIDEDGAMRIRESNPANAKTRWASVRKVARVLPVGMDKAVNIYEVIPPEWPWETALQQQAKLWEKAVEEFLQGKWREAKARFTRYKADLPNTFRKEDLCVDKLLAIIGEATVAPEGWDGIYRLEAK